MTVTSLVAYMQNYQKWHGLNVFERGEKLLHNGILNFTFMLSQPSEIALES